MRAMLRSAVAFTLLALPAFAQTAPRIGPTFGAELAAAGCATGVAWAADGTLTLASGVSPACPNQVLAAHDPTKLLGRRAPLSALLDPLSVAQRAAITTDHMNRLDADATEQGGTLDVSNEKIIRAAGDLGMTPTAWFTLAGF